MSLIHQNLEFHNVAALEDSPGLPGKILPRYPAATRRFLSERGRFVSMESTGCEIRFVTAAPNVRLFLSHLEADQEATVYRGEFLVGRYAVPMGKVTCLHLAPPERFDWVRPEMLRGAFDAAVWRICFNRATAVFHGIDAFGHEVRPPDPSEKPGKRWLAYGSSITHGNLLSYIFHTGRILGLDLSNKGLSGACQIEAAAADYLADGVAYEVATLELGVNMRDGLFTSQEFEKRATYLVERLIGKNPQTPHFLITIFPNFDDFRPAGKETTGTQNHAAFDEAIRRIHANESGRRSFPATRGTLVLKVVPNVSTAKADGSDFYFFSVPYDANNEISARYDGINSTKDRVVLIRKAAGTTTTLAGSATLTEGAAFYLVYRWASVADGELDATYGAAASGQANFDVWAGAAGAVAKIANGSGAIPTESTDSRFQIGGKSGDCLEGRVSSVLVLPRVLSDEEIQRWCS